MSASQLYDRYFDGRVRVYPGPRVVVPPPQDVCFTEWKLSLVDALLVADYLNTARDRSTLTDFTACTESHVVCGEHVSQILQTITGFDGTYGKNWCVEWFMSTWVVEESKHVAPHEFRVGRVWGDVLSTSHPACKAKAFPGTILMPEFVYSWDPVSPRGISPAEHKFTLIDLLRAMTGGHPMQIRCGARAYETLSKLPGANPTKMRLKWGEDAARPVIILNSVWHLVLSPWLKPDEIETSAHVRGFIPHVEEKK